MNRRHHGPSKTRLVLVVLVAVAVAVAIAFQWANAEPSYTNATYGFSFAYPKAYALTEQAPAGGPAIDAITLAPKGNASPSAISVDVYKYPGAAAFTDWLGATPSTHFASSSAAGAYATSTLMGSIPAVAYHWSDTQNEESFALANGNYAVVFTGPYASSTDAIKTDFEAIVSSIQILP